MKIVKPAFLALLLSSCFNDEMLPSDQQTWEYATPTEIGSSNDAFFELDSSIVEGRYERISGLIIIKEDKLIFENYYNDSISRHTPVPLGSSSIVLTIAGIGIANDKGLLELSDPIRDFLPGYERFFASSELKQNITIENLLTHQSGISWNESVVPLLGNPFNHLNQMTASDNWIEFILAQPLDSGPGLRYNFNSGIGIILARIIENASGQPFDKFLSENLLSLIGASSFEVTRDPTGNQDGGRGVLMTLLDWTKFSYIILQNGIKDGRKIIDPGFIALATSVRIAVSSTFNFGYGWRLFGERFQNFLPFDHTKFFYVTGETGQDQYVSTSEQMIISIYADNYFGSQNQSFYLFLDILELFP